jgi:hypothetical protein
MSQLKRKPIHSSTLPLINEGSNLHYLSPEEEEIKKGSGERTSEAKVG